MIGIRKRRLASIAKRKLGIDGDWTFYMGN